MLAAPQLMLVAMPIASEAPAMAKATTRATTVRTSEKSRMAAATSAKVATNTGRPAFPWYRLGIVVS